MRTSVISRFVATSAAALTLGVALPMIVGTDAWAVCGADLKSAGKPVAPRHQGELTTTQLADAPTSLVAGGAAVEIPIRVTNNTDGAYQAVEPILGLGWFVNGHDLQLGDIKAAWKTDGAWHDLPLQMGCTRGIVNEDDALPVFRLDKGASKDVTVRLAVPANAQKALDRFTYSFGPQAEDHQGRSVSGTVSVTRPKAKPAPTGTPSTPAVAPAAVTTTPTATATTAAPATPAPAAAQQELASTGPSKATGFLFWSAGAMLALGGAVLYGVKRFAKR